MARYLTAGNGWKSIAVAVLLYEALCVEEELLSRGFDRLLERHPWWPRIVVLTVALHLINWIPERFDPFGMAIDVTRLGGRNERLTAWGKRLLNCGAPYPSTRVSMKRRAWVASDQ